jgi:putative iron-only hydrogenase system regulator
MKLIYISDSVPVGRRGLFISGGKNMETRIAVIAIIVEDRDSAASMNSVLHEYAEYIIGRMGIPYREKGISLVSVAVDAPNEIINALTGKLGNIAGLTAKAAYSKA